MKEYIIHTLAIIIVVFLGPYNRDDADTKRSIFDPTEVYELSEFDKWLFDNYVYTRNIQVKYHLDDNGTGVEYYLVPTKYDNTIVLAKIAKFVQMEAYDGIQGVGMIRTHASKLLQPIGDVVYIEPGMVFGQAEGEMKVTLFRAGEIDRNNLSAAQLDEYHLKIMYHEPIHILNQKKAYDTSYDRISELDHADSSWYRVSESVTLQKGSISPYAMDRATEDLAEMVAIYITDDTSTWEDMLASAGTTGKPIVEKKFEITLDYIFDSWGLDLDKLRGVTLRRQSEITELDSSML